MRRCIEIAKNGWGTTAPNPMVGAVIVHENKIIGEGYTSPYGGPHAEVNAIKSVVNKTLLKEATLYVTLEPCSHYGKTPPCTNLIIQHKIPKIVIGVGDPNSKVAGMGITHLKDSGCEVILGVLEKECRVHHQRFLCFQEKKRPYIILKWAETSDGFIAPSKEKREKNPQPYWITNAYSRQLVHQWRSQEQAILVGTKTVLEDNPKLDVRKWKGKNPLRVVLDKQLKIPSDYTILDKSTPTLIVTQVTDKTKYHSNIDYEVIDFSKDLSKQITTALYKRSITSLIIEGGAKTIQTFIDANLWDEARVFKGTVYFNEGIKAPHLSGKIQLKKTIEGDLLKIYNP